MGLLIPSPHQGKPCKPLWYKGRMVTYNPGHNILELYILMQIRFTTSKTKLYIQYRKLGIRVASRVAERLASWDLRKLRNIRNLKFGWRQGPGLSSRNLTLAIFFSCPILLHFSSLFQIFCPGLQFKKYLLQKQFLCICQQPDNADLFKGHGPASPGVGGWVGGGLMNQTTVGGMGWRKSQGIKPNGGRLKSTRTPCRYTKVFRGHPFKSIG